MSLSPFVCSHGWVRLLFRYISSYLQTPRQFSWVPLPTPVDEKPHQLSGMPLPIVGVEDRPCSSRFFIHYFFPFCCLLFSIHLAVICSDSFSGMPLTENRLEERPCVDHPLPLPLVLSLLQILSSSRTPPILRDATASGSFTRPLRVYFSCHCTSPGYHWRCPISRNNCNAVGLSDDYHQSFPSG